MIEVIHTGARPVLRLAGRRPSATSVYGATASSKPQLSIGSSTTKQTSFGCPSLTYTPLMGAGFPTIQHAIRCGLHRPWVYQLTQHEPPLSRACGRIGRLILEPRAIRSASIISGVAEAYFAPAADRTFKNKQRPTTAAFPTVSTRGPTKNPVHPSSPFDPSKGRYILYAGAFLLHSESIARCLFRAIASLKRNGLWHTYANAICGNRIATWLLHLYAR